MTFDYPKPPEILSFTQGTGTTQETKLKEDNSTLTLRESLPEYLEELIEKHKDNFQILDEFGIKQLSEQWLLSMHIDNRRWLIGKSDILVTFRDDFVVKLILSYA
jgi:predicted CopG family antitoxin